MKETMQVNIRLSKKLIEDIEYITQNLKVNRNDWLKVKLAELIVKEKIQKELTQTKLEVQ